MSLAKTLESIKTRVDIRLVSSDKDRLYFSKPVYLGMRILDLSKSLMYDFHENYIKTKYGDKAKLFFTDIDSLAYEITTKDIYKDINPDIEKRFDTNDYRLIIHLELKKDLIVKCLQCLRMKRVGSTL